MKWTYAEPGFITEMMVDDKPVLLSVEPFAADQQEEAEKYAQEVWEWLLSQRGRIEDEALRIVSLKNAHWLEVGEPPMTVEDMLPHLQTVAAVYARGDEGIMIYFDVGDVFAGNSVVVLISPTYTFRGIQIM